MTNTGSQRHEHHVVMLTFPDAQMLDVTGPLEVFSRTSRWLQDHMGHRGIAYQVEVVAEEAGSVRMSSGLELIATRSCYEVERADTLMVSGGVGHEPALKNDRLLGWLSEAAGRSSRTASICNGALLLGAAGLLKGKRATTHWAYCDQLSKLTGEGQVLPDSIFVQDGNIYTSAGVTAGMDLALALVEEDWGRTVALRVAQELVMYLVRPGGQSQFSRQLKAQQREGRFGELELWMIGHLEEPQPVERLAEIAGMSPRHFTRRFTDEFGMAPAAYLTHLRVERARVTLEESPEMRLKELARQCGFASEQNLRRAFLRTLSITPEDYRARFGSRAEA